MYSSLWRHPEMARSVLRERSSRADLSVITAVLWKFRFAVNVYYDVVLTLARSTGKFNNNCTLRNILQIMRFVPQKRDWLLWNRAVGHV